MSSLKESNKEMSCNNIDREFYLSELSVVKSDINKQSLESTVKSNPSMNVYVSDKRQIESLPPTNKCSLQYSNKDIDTEFRLSDLDVVESDNSEQCILKSDKTINLCVPPQRNSTEINRLIPSNSDNRSTKVLSTDTTQKQTFGQNVRLWWKKRKSRFVQIFTVCMCCAKSSKTEEE